MHTQLINTLPVNCLLTGTLVLERRGRGRGAGTGGRGYREGKGVEESCVHFRDRRL